LSFSAMLHPCRGCREECSQLFPIFPFLVKPPLLSVSPTIHSPLAFASPSCRPALLGLLDEMTNSESAPSPITPSNTISSGTDLHGVVELAASHLLLAAGRGPARVHSCEQTLRHTRFVGSKVQDHFVASALLLCALALLRAGERRVARRGPHDRCA
jgi:hypothetical protein